MNKLIYLDNLPSKDIRVGYLELIMGSMYSGKSEELIRRLKRLKYANRTHQLFKPAMDNRYAETEVVTHAGERLLAISVESPEQILEKLHPKTQFVGIDEIQFFQSKNSEGKYEIIDVIERLNKKGVIVLAAGLDMYSTGETFGPMERLPVMAKFVDKIHAVCQCGGKAWISYNIGKGNDTNNQSQVKLGSFHEYVAVCENCLNDLNKK